MVAKPKIKLMLDSGAFTAWGKNQTIDVNDYIRYVKRCQPFLDSYVNLDVIPGSIGWPRTVEAVEASAAQSYRNLQVMKDAGLKPLPVFHQGEDFRWLERMLKEGETYIGISTSKNQPNAVQREWLDIIFAAVTDQAGRPLVRVHGFGAGHVDLLRRYPFYSVDTAGWSKAAAFGKIYAPPYRDGAPDFLGTPELVTMSGRFQESRYSQSRHLSNPQRYGAQAVADICHFIERGARLSVSDVRSDPAARGRLLAIYYLGVRDALPADLRFQQPRSLRPDELRVGELLSSRPPLKLPPLKLFFATAYDRVLCDVLLGAGATHHLLSFWELKKRPEVLEYYVMNGKVVDGRRERAA
jgi:hypothetical protein